MKPNEGLTPEMRTWLKGLVKGHYRRVVAYLHRHMSEQSAIEDIAQDVFVEVIPKYEKLKDKETDDSAAYLHGIARNLVRNHYRKLKKAKKLREGSVDFILAQRVEDDDDVQVNYLKGCVEKLPEESRALVNQHYFQSIPTVQIAETMDKTPDALRMSLMRIRRALRACIEKQVAQEAAS